MAEWKGKSRGGITGYKIFIAILKNSGLPIAYFLLYFVAFYYFIFSPASFRNIFSFYRNRLHYGFLRAINAVYCNYYQFGQIILDKMAVTGGFDTSFSFEFEGEDYLRKIVSDGTGGLLISAHIGNFEMAGHMLQRLNTRVNILMLDAEHQRIKEYLSTVARKSFHIIPIGEDLSHIYAISEALKNHELICMHGDRFMPGTKTIRVKFLGKDALLPTGPFYLAMKFAVPVSFVFAMKDSKKHYHFFATPPSTYVQPATSAEREEMLTKIITDYVVAIEEKIYQYPFQWFNYYDFWFIDPLKA